MIANPVEPFAPMIKKHANSIARRCTAYTRSRMDLDDLISEGNRAALEAIGNWDEARGTLESFVGANVWFAMQRLAGYNTYDLHVPYSAQYKAHEAGTSHILRENARAFSIDSENKLNNYLQSNNENPRKSQVTYDDIAAMPSGEPPPVDKMIGEEHAAIIEKVLFELDDRERTVIKARFFEDKKPSREEVAQRMNLTMPTVAHIEQGALAKLKFRLKGLSND